jgi:hypothetical protein
VLVFLLIKPLLFLDTLLLLLCRHSLWQEVSTFSWQTDPQASMMLPQALPTTQMDQLLILDLAQLRVLALMLLVLPQA